MRHQWIARIEKAEDLPLLFEFYRAYQACTDERDRESFDVAARWGQTLLSDFNEIDRYLLPCKDVFSTLQDVEHIENWDPSAPLSPLMEQHKNFWHLAEKLYHTLREQLLSQGIGYPGMVLRRAAENIGRSSDTLQERTRWIFAGFNAMSSAEQRILKYFVEEKNAEIYYDADRYYLDNPRHSAGTFLRRLKDDAILGRNFRWIGQDLSRHKHCTSSEYPAKSRKPKPPHRCCGNPYPKGIPPKTPRWCWRTKACSSPCSRPCPKKSPR